MALRDKQAAFVNEYLIDFNATRAAQRAGYEGDENVLAVQGYRLLRNAKIAEAIQARLSERALTASEVIMRLGEQARNEHGKYVDKDGTVDLSKLIADGKSHLIKGIKETKYGKNIEFYDAQAALALLGKHHNIFKEETEHTGEIVVRVKYGNEGTDSPTTKPAPETA